jgi:hypothetical protein
MGKPGRKPHPARNLRDAAILFALAVESEGDMKNPWNRLRMAALRYQEEDRPYGRPTGSLDRPMTDRQRTP